MKNNPTIVLVVAVALVGTDGAVLLQQRRPGSAHAGQWEFPGGKVEAGETLESALIREIEEELGIGLASAALEPLTFITAPDGPHVILLYTCRDWVGEPRGVEGNRLDWARPDALLSYPLVALDIPLAKAVIEHLNKVI